MRRDVGAGIRQRVREDDAQAVGAAGDECGLAREVEHRRAHYAESAPAMRAASRVFSSRQRDRHGAGTAGHRGEPPGDLDDGVEVDVAHDPLSVRDTPTSITAAPGFT